MSKKIKKIAGWLIPGLEIKRWFGLVFIGLFFVVLGFMMASDMRPLSIAIEWIRHMATILPTGIIGGMLMIIGFGLFFLGWQKTNVSTWKITNVQASNNDDILETLYRKRKLNRGPKIVAIGGGTGLSMLLKGIKKITNNVTAVVTVGDDGGSSGRLREEIGVLPPGDIRNCIAALADDEDLITKLFQYRFKKGEGLEGHSFGNLFLTALCAITGNMYAAVKESSNVLSIRGRVLPSTLDDMKLVAEMEDGRIVRGESNIPESGGKIKRLYSDPEDCKALDDVLKAIKSADLIILGPGSLYTSVIPNLLIKEISQAVSDSNAKKIYVCNVMTQPGETDGYTVFNHINAILSHAGHQNIIDAVLVNDKMPENISSKYEEAGSFPVKLDDEPARKKNIQIVSKKLIEENKDGLVRHSSNRVARAVYYWYRKSGKKED